MWTRHITTAIVRFRDLDSIQNCVCSFNLVLNVMMVFLRPKHVTVENKLLCSDETYHNSNAETVWEECGVFSVPLTSNLRRYI